LFRIAAKKRPLRWSRHKWNIKNAAADTMWKGTLNSSVSKMALFGGSSERAYEHNRWALLD
jgi:hypothetical protein